MSPPDEEEEPEEIPQDDTGSGGRPWWLKGKQMSDDFESLQAEQDAALDEQARFKAQVARLSNYEFERWKKVEIARAEAAKARAKPAVREMSEEEQRLNRMDSVEYKKFLEKIGINSRLDVTQSDAMKHERKRSHGGT